MLSALSISDFVLVDRLDLETRHGFTALTGETGAGKSILLDAIGVLIGGRADKRFVRSGASRATIIAAFEPPAHHSIWQEIEDAGIDADPAEALIAKRIIPSAGPARSYLNAQPVSGAFLAETVGGLVEIHGQHASAHLLRAASHMEIVDQFAGNGSLLQACGSAWQRLKDTRAARCQIEADLRSALEQRDELLRDIEDLRRLAPVAGEARTLARQRQQLSQVSKLRDTLKEVKDTLFANETVERAGWAAGSLQRLTKLPGFDAPSASNGLEQLLTATADAFERAAIELNEAVESLSRLADVANGDDLELEHIEGRLFALRAAARKHRVDVDSLSDCLERLECSLQLTDRGDQQLAAARKEEADAAAQWRAAAESLSQARRVAAKRLEKVVKRQLVPLKLEKVRLRFRIDPLTEEEAGHRGMDKIAIEVETNPGSGFGPLHKIASGGELARISLALKCAAAESSETPVTMIFDEADQGVGGAVAAAIGERLQELATRHQVFAVTHSPQVAASAEAHWRIEKSGRGKSLGQMRASVLDAQERTEEIARMLSGLKITREARAAAHRLLEG